MRGLCRAADTARVMLVTALAAATVALFQQPILAQELSIKSRSRCRLQY